MGHIADSIAALGAEPLLKALRWRCAVKKFDASRQIPEKTWDALLHALVLAPSSYGLQPWKFFVIEDKALRQKLQAVSWGQAQIVDADKLVVFTSRKGFSAADVERHVARVAEVRKVAPASLEGFKKNMLGILSRPPEVLQAWVARQVYIALGTFLTSAAVLGIDACPMEGIDGAKYDEILGLGVQGYTALCVATAGYRASDDAYALATKVRFPLEQVVEKR